MAAIATKHSELGRRDSVSFGGLGLILGRRNDKTRSIYYNTYLRLITAYYIQANVYLTFCLFTIYRVVEQMTPEADLYLVVSNGGE